MVRCLGTPKLIPTIRSKPGDTPMDKETEEQIRLMAYALWERDDRPHGRDL
ncbi:MAG: DUF2934 domain-containing protein, partial [Magnetococcales bacterium]|nr:DUF2934 domain-containing protein [Magnetococcales bacterium]